MKKFLLIILSLIMAVAFTSCGDISEVSTPVPVTPEDLIGTWYTVIWDVTDGEKTPMGVSSMTFSADGKCRVEFDEMVAEHTWTAQDGVVTLVDAEGNRFVYQSTKIGDTVTMVANQNENDVVVLMKNNPKISGSDAEAKILGTWYFVAYDAVMTYTFTAEHTVVMSFEGQSETVSWSISEDVFTITDVDGDTYEYYMYLIDGCFMLVGKEESDLITFYRERPSPGGNVPDEGATPNEPIKPAPDGSESVGGGSVVIGPNTQTAISILITPEKEFKFNDSITLQKQTVNNVVTKMTMVFANGDTLVVYEVDGEGNQTVSAYVMVTISDPYVSVSNSVWTVTGVTLMQYGEGNIVTSKSYTVQNGNIVEGGGMGGIVVNPDIGDEDEEDEVRYEEVERQGATIVSRYMGRRLEEVTCAFTNGKRISIYTYSSSYQKIMAEYELTSDDGGETIKTVVVSRYQYHEDNHGDMVKTKRVKVYSFPDGAVISESVTEYDRNGNVIDPDTNGGDEDEDDAVIVVPPATEENTTPRLEVYERDGVTVEAVVRGDELLQETWIFTNGRRVLTRMVDEDGRILVGCGYGVADDGETLEVILVSVFEYYGDSNVVKTETMTEYSVPDGAIVNESVNEYDENGNYIK